MSEAVIRERVEKSLRKWKSMQLDSYTIFTPHNAPAHCPARTSTTKKFLIKDGLQALKKKSDTFVITPCSEECLCLVNPFVPGLSDEP